MTDNFDVPYPVELVIGQTPVSSQSKNAKAKQDWDNTIGDCARTAVHGVRELYFLDKRAVMVTIFYFPSAPMQGDIDNIVKPILDGMVDILYPDDSYIERLVVQKFEPGVAWIFPSASGALAAAIDMEKPSLYIRLDDDLAWRQAP